MDAKNNTSPNARTFACNLYEYNHDRYDHDSDPNAPDWLLLQDRIVFARNEHRAETLFLDKLREEDVYMPRVADRQIEVIELTTFAELERYGFGLEHLGQVITDPEAISVAGQYRAIAERLDVDALLILGVKRPGPGREEQGEQTLMGTENTGLTLGEMHGIAARLMNDVNNAYVKEKQFPPFPFASQTGQSGGNLITPKPKGIITKLK